jgi:hypothetical protein
MGPCPCGPVKYWCCIYDDIAEVFDRTLEMSEYMDAYMPALVY